MAEWWSNEIFPNANRSNSTGGKIGWGIVDAALIIPRGASMLADQVPNPLNVIRNNGRAAETQWQRAGNPLNRALQMPK